MSRQSTTVQVCYRRVLARHSLKLEPGPFYLQGDNHVLELAIAAQAEAVVTHNRSDFLRAELRFPELRILSPAELLNES